MQMKDEQPDVELEPGASSNPFSGASTHATSSGSASSATSDMPTALPLTTTTSSSSSATHFCACPTVTFAGPSDFVFQKELGYGAFSRVCLVEHVASGRQFALKTVQLVTDELNASIIRELGVLEKTRQYRTCIIEYYGYFLADGALNIVLEYMDAGSLATLRTVPSGPQADAVVSAVAGQMLTGLAVLHEAHVVHRDIKPGNVLVNSKGEVKFADFNTSRVMRDSMDNAFSFTGSAVYMAPERLTGERGHSYASDLWSAGVTLYELVSGQNPFVQLAGGDTSFFSLIYAINEGHVVRVDEMRPDLSKECGDLIADCLKKDPAERASSSELLHRLYIQRYAAQAHAIVRAWVASVTSTR